MKRLIAAAALLSAMTCIASAADLPMRSAPPPFVPPPPVFTWTGFYAGINAGYTFDDDSKFHQGCGNTGGTCVLPPLGTGRPLNARNSDDGFTGGGQIGYNVEFPMGGLNGVVVGLEADAAYTDLGTRTDVTGPVGPQITRFHSQLDYLGTVRGRLGYAIDRTLIYATGGLAYGEVEDAVTFFNTPGVLNGRARFRGTQDSVNTGWTVGGGVEYALPTNNFLNFFHSSAVTVKAEYLYYDLGSSSFALTPVLPLSPGVGAGAFYRTHVATDGNLVRLGLNYKF